jgi:hypothetical protein
MCMCVHKIDGDVGFGGANSGSGKESLRKRGINYRGGLGVERCGYRKPPRFSHPQGRRVSMCRRGEIPAGVYLVRKRCRYNAIIILFCLSTVGALECVPGECACGCRCKGKLQEQTGHQKVPQCRTMAPGNFFTILAIIL